MTNLKIARVATLFGCALTWPAFASTIVTFQVPSAVSTGASAINSNGDVTGTWTDTNQQTHCFLRTSDGTITTFDLPSNTGFTILSINDQDEIVGIWSPQNNPGTHGFMVIGGVVTSFDPPGATATYSAFINDSGAIAGNYENSGSSQGYIMASDGSFTSFAAPSGYSIYTVGGFNANGDIAGTLNSTELFLRYSDGSFSTTKSLDVNIPSVPSFTTSVAGVNISDQVVGTSDIAGTKPIDLPFVWTPGGAVTRFIPGLGPTSTKAVGINDSGEITGSIYSYNTASFSGFFRSSDGTTTPFEVGTVSTLPTGINNSEIICGTTITADSNPDTVGFLYTP
jgi:probable HAF family extracellular repeat protein